MTVERWHPHFQGLYDRFCEVGIYPGVAAFACGTGLLVMPDAYRFWPTEVRLTLAGMALMLMVPGLRRFPLVRPVGERQVSGYPMLTLLSLVLLGYSYGHWFMTDALSARVPLCADEKVRHFEMEVVSAPQDESVALAQGRTQAVSRFAAIIRPPVGDECLTADDYRVRLSWYDPPLLLLESRWQVEARLRPPWGNSNPGGFDYERWLLGQAFNGTGYVRSGRLLSDSVTPDHRTKLRAELAHWLASLRIEHEGIVLALMTGDDSALTREDWQSLRDSGTVHLLVVSGLHVGMVTGFLYFLARLLLRPGLLLFQRIGAGRLAGILAISGSGFYVWLTGAGVPAVRAWTMGALLLAAHSSGRRVPPLRVVGAVMALTVLSNPLVVHQQGFWLSFVAVLALVAFFQPMFNAPGGLIQRLLRPPADFVRVQILLLLVLSPLLAGFQGGIPLQAPLVNSLVVPVVTFAALPLILIAGVLFLVAPDPAGWVVQQADGLLDHVMDAIEAAAEIPAVAMGVDGPIEWLLIGLGLIFMGCRPAMRSQLVLILLWWAILLPDQTAPDQGGFRVTALDVGQGSAILVDTRQHRLIYDTGPAYPSGFNLGAAVVVPSFRRARHQSLAALVLSHDDVDHTGGAGAVIRSLQPRMLWSSFAVPAELEGAHVARTCQTGEQWRWDGVTFRFLHPPAGWRGEDNDSSCVLLVSDGRHSALLGGDITERVERRLRVPPVDLLFAPHHGSRTSSSVALVHRAQPGIVFISTARRSRYGHPHPDVIGRYAASDIHVSGHHGALVWESWRPNEVLRWREVSGAYWHRWPQSDKLALSSL